MRPALLVWAGLAACAPAQSGDKGTARPTAPATKEARFEGRVVAANATSIQAPPTSYSLNGRLYNHRWSKIEHLADDESRVEEGAVVARFKFFAKDELPRIKSRIKSRRAESDRTKVGLEMTLGKLLTQQKKAALRTEAARLDTLKGGAVSAQRVRIYELQYAMTKFEAQAITKRIAAHRDTMAAQDARDRLRVAHADQQLALYALYAKRFEIRAPHMGVVNYQRHPWHRRKVRKGDGLPSGSPVLSLANDRVLAVEIFIPEAAAARVQLGDTLEVFSIADDRRWQVSLSEIRPFPQQLGFLHKDDAHPRALERAYVGVASLPADVDGLSMGNEVEVQFVGQAGAGQ